MSAQKARTNEDYIALDDAIATLEGWKKEIKHALIEQGTSADKCEAAAFVERFLGAARRAHSPEE